MNMSDNQPQSEPRLQKKAPGGEITVGFVDPCLVFLEANDQGFPVLVACWGRSSQETKKPGEPSLLELRSVLVFAWHPNTGRTPGIRGISEEPTPWLFRAAKVDLLQITGDAPDIRLMGHSPLAPVSLATLFANRLHVKYLTTKETASLKAHLEQVPTVNQRPSYVSLANFILMLGKLNWSSMPEAARALNSHKEAKHLSPSDIQEIMEAVRQQLSGS